MSIFPFPVDVSISKFRLILRPAFISNDESVSIFSLIVISLLAKIVRLLSAFLANKSIFPETNTFPGVSAIFVLSVNSISPFLLTIMDEAFFSAPPVNNCGKDRGNKLESAVVESTSKLNICPG